MLASRRLVLGGLSAAVAGFAGLKLLGSGSAAEARADIEGYGPLLPDPNRLLDLPRGFSYRILSRTGDPMSDGLLTPGAFDGMAAFRVRGNRHQVALVRNHEIWPDDVAGGAFGPGHALLARVPRTKLFDLAADGAPKLGGTTTLIWDMRARRVVRSHLSLAGTCGNCAGGPTPWGSWLSCEETIEKAAPRVSRPHGWVFEVPSAAGGLVDPVPLTAM
ncbi:MAG TPA: alkaline phosphatase PhoX, partial [Sphingomicrobium sp.]|nr:alkaline phosphatase PhoX [Sphingomicrobium sp.]